MMDETKPADSTAIAGARSRHEALNALISQLYGKLSGVRSNIEKEFLSAYRVHMLTIQSELKSLKLQVSKAEDALNDDGAVAKLEQEVNWFSEETGRLKMHAASMRKDMHHIIARVEALCEQRLFLAEQLKSVLKRSKVLEAELGYIRKAAPGSDQTDTMGIDVKVMKTKRTNDQKYFSQNALHTDFGTGPYGSVVERRAPVQRDAAAKHSTGQRLGVSASAGRLEPLSHSNARMTRGVSPQMLRTTSTEKVGSRQLVSDPVDKLLGTKQLSRASSEFLGKTCQRNAGKKTDTGLSTVEQLKRAHEGRVPEEVVLEDLVISRFGKIMQRRARTLTHTKSNAGLKNQPSQLAAKLNHTFAGPFSHNSLGLSPMGGHLSSNDEDEFEGEEGESRGKVDAARRSGDASLRRVTGLTGLGLEHFTDHDRFSVMVDFLSEPDIFNKVVQVLGADFVASAPAM